MINKLSPLYQKRIGASNSRFPNLLQNMIGALDTLISVLMVLVASIFFTWLNSKQREFDVLEDTVER